MMKLLFDQNISFRIIKKLEAILPLATQVRLLGLENSEDFEIWEYARINGYSIVTFDTDFYDISLIKGVPPKIIWLRMGNSSTNSIVNCVIRNFELIQEYIENSDYKDLACIEIEQ